MSSKSSGVRSRCNRRLPAALGALALVPFLSAALAADRQQPVGEPEIREAVAVLGEDPALETERTVRRLEWIGESEKEIEKPPGWMAWLGFLFGWLAEASRVLVWLLIAALVALFLLYALRLARAFGRDRVGEAGPLPTHVRDLDIRPESLPDDIGAAAWELWERGRQREAIALMYRGLLSRLVHVHDVPIRDSSTEGDSLRLAENHLPQARHGYVARLIRTWQRAVYGGEDPQGAEMRVLCERFAAELRPPPPTAKPST